MKSTFSRATACLVAMVAAVAATAAPTARADVQFEGRDLIYRKHVDAVHITYGDGGLDIKVREGYDTIRNAADVAIRLGPDADEDGNEVSRMVVPEGAAYAFMGAPGDIVWHAPQRLYQGWPPVWAGIGHGDLPAGLTDLRLELVDDGGPGDVEIFTTVGVAGLPQRQLSSSDPAHRSYTPGSHGHYSWIFTEPGTYRMQWRATAQLDGRPVASPVVTVPWLVGPDEAVGLPPGSTVANPITRPVDGPALPSPTPSDDATPVPTGPAPVPDHDFADNLTKHLNFCEPVPSGHLDLSTVARGDGSLWLRALLDGAQGPEVLPLNGAVLEVPDAARQEVPTGAVADQLRQALGTSQVWELPDTQDPGLPWPGFSTERLDYANIAHLTYSVTEFAAPAGGGWALGGYDPARGRFVVSLDSTRHGSQSIQLDEPSHMHTGFYFSQPGYYTLKFRVEATPKDPATMPAWKRSSNLSVHFAVSDAAVAFACDRMGESLPAPAPEDPAVPSPDPEPEDSATTTPGADPTDAPTEQPADPATQEPDPVPGGAAPADPDRTADPADSAAPESPVATQAPGSTDPEGPSTTNPPRKPGLPSTGE